MRNHTKHTTLLFKQSCYILKYIISKTCIYINTFIIFNT